MQQLEIQQFPLWERLKHRRTPLSFDLEITARCNCHCRHCYINLPANDPEARAKELTTAEIIDIGGQAVELGAIWCLLTGGEPLLRDDFAEIFLGLKRLGLLITVFTNATIIRPEHIALFKQYPPRDIEITVYGSHSESYEGVTRKPGTFAAFRRGLDGLVTAGLKVRLKTMAIRSNIKDMEAIAAFSRTHTKDYYRFDPQLHLRYDGDALRNEEIRQERLTPDEIVALEQADAQRLGMMQENQETLINDNFTHTNSDHLFHCGTGNGSFTVGYDGKFRLCSSLCAPGTTIDLRNVRLREVWETWVPKVRDLRSHHPEYLSSCRQCPIVNLCLHCPAHAHLETGAMDGATPYFCAVAHARAANLETNAV
jgi:radical SAM protein with 4Fe4S-binding SPASM domain